MKKKIKTLFIHLLLSIFQKWRKPFQNKSSRWLIVSTTALGDTLWATAAIRNLKKTDPEISLYLLTSPLGKEVLRENPYIEEIFLFKKPFLKSFFVLVRHLRTYQFSKILLFHTSQRLTLPLCSLLGAEKIVGTEGLHKGMDFLLTDKQKPLFEHEILRRCKIAGIPCEDPSMDFFTTKEEELFAEKFLRNKGINCNKQLIIIHPGAKDFYKCWPLDHFAAVGCKLNKQILVTGDLREKELITQLAKKIPGAVALNETLSLRQFAAIIKKSQLVLTNDTGPMHLATALKVPVIAPFGPTQPELCGPYLCSYAIALAKPKTCTPCLERKCKRPFCLLQIAPQDMYNSALQLLNKSDIL